MSDEARLLRIEERLAALEAATTQEPAAPAGAAPRSATLPAERFWVLDGLRADADAPPGGAVVYAGRVTLPTGEEYEWQMAHPAAQVRGSEETDPGPASAFAALGHPVRLRLLREVLGGVRTTAELATLPGLGTTGQLHHHLRQLTAAGWLRTTARGAYAVPGERVVPLHVVLAAVSA